ncbi:hypothetical protein [Psychrobacter sp. DAB_AL43B]|uniref:hypothetical protein n=1 Tax=Psychrobacter sp. DAB_AL43B TaxID=1028416 RepID=UPI0009A609C1|nr:hypothetical protein [Psychrobacter sp. DAB_AL43B]SLJ83374.1 hypothetical protein DABAL43B_0152 [Psychrobacter sp. DAB_AL43B]
MKNRTLSLLIGAALTIPSLAMAAPAETAPVDMQDAATATTLETEAGNADNESVSNQSNPFQISETQSVSRASVNNNASQQQMATELQAQPKAMLLEQQPKAMLLEQQPKAMLLEQEALLDSEEDSSQVEDTAAL